MSITRDDAAEIARQSLNDMAAEINAYGSALPGYADQRRTELVMTIEEEFDDGWLFAYNSRAFVQDGDSSSMLLGNYPMFITRMDGTVHSTADLEYRHYLDQLRERRRAIKSCVATGDNVPS
jgi:hypothetical protein